MANYPISCYEEGSSINVDAGTKMDMSDGGTLRARRLFAEPIYDISLKHTVESADLATLLTFYDNNADEAITWADNVYSPADTYTVYFQNAPSYTPHAGPYWEVSVMLKGTKDA